MNKPNKPLINFPTRFPIKVLGLNSEELIAEVTAIVSAKCHDFNPEKNITITPSAKSNYISITATITATSQQQLDDIYIALNKHPLVKLTL